MVKTKGLAELSQLSIGDYYYRITPKVDQFYAVITNPTDGQVFIGTLVDISGNVVIVD